MPVAIAGDAVALVDVFLFVAMLAIALILWTTLQARGPAGSVPVVGNVLVGAIDGIRIAVTNLALAIEQFLSWQQSQVNDLWTRFIAQVVNPIFAGVQNAVVGIGLQVEHLTNVAVPAVAAGLTAVESAVYSDLDPRVGQLEHDAGDTATWIADVATPEIAALQIGAATAALAASNLAGRVTTLEADLVAAESVLARLAAFLPILSTLATFETTSAGGVTALDRQIGLTQSQLKDLQDQLAKLVALGGLAALGAVAIANLTRVAKDPCTACEGNDLSDYEQRLFALEMFGET